MSPIGNEPCVLLCAPRRGGASHEQICDLGIMGMWYSRVITLKLSWLASPSWVDIYAHPGLPASAKKHPFLRRPLPCSPAAGTALQPPIWCSEKLALQCGVAFRRKTFFTDWYGRMPEVGWRAIGVSASRHNFITFHTPFQTLFHTLGKGASERDTWCQH